MRALRNFVAIVFAFLVIPTLANAQVDPYLKQKQEQMLHTSLVIDTDDSTGSGFTVFSAEVSGPGDSKRIESLVITNYHVVKSSHKTKMIVRVGLKQYDSNFRETGLLYKYAEVFAVDEDNDLALLRLRDYENKLPYVAHLARIGVKLEPFERVWTVGATFSEPPLISQGILSSMDVYFPGGTRYMRLQMYANVGNSGGAVFHYDAERGYEVIGVLSAIYARPESVSKKIHVGEKKEGEEVKPEEVQNRSKIKTEGNISYSIPPEVLQGFLMQIGRQIGINFFQ